MIGLLCFALAVLASPFKSKLRLEAENAVLRHQLIILRRRLHGRVRLTNHDRCFFIQLYHWFPSILQVLTIIRPETLVRWHRAGFRRYWRWKSSTRGGRPQIHTELRALMSIENPLWGAPRIPGELLKLGFVAERREWDGPAVLPPLTARRIRWGFQRARGGHAMPSNAETAVARTIGIDTGKNTLHMIGLDEKGAIVLREKVSRTRIAARFVNLPPCLVGIEAGMASHYVARELVGLGHEVKQVPPAYCKPFRQSHKNDFRDAHAVAEAVERPSTRCVPIKTDGQLDLQALHRLRSRLIGNRTAAINQTRGFLLEHGIPVRQGHHFLRQQLPQILATRTDVLSPRMVRIIGDLMTDWKYLDERIEGVTDEIEALAHADEGCQQLITVPGIGPIISSAMVAAIGNGAAFCKGRDFAAWLGLVPKQRSTGDRTILGRITKRGNRYLRMLFIQGARAVLLRPASWAKHSFGSWLTAATRRLHRNVLAVALANKLARIAWTVLAQGRRYEARVEPRVEAAA
jgi:transposase